MNKMQIIQDHLAGLSNRQIAKKYRMSRKTVNKYITEYEKAQHILLTNSDPQTPEVRQATETIISAPAYKKRKTTRHKWNEQMEADLNRILADEDRKKKLLRSTKQQLTKRQIYELMRDLGHDIGYTTICEKINLKRNLQKEAFIAQSYPYGQRFEYDFGEILLSLAGKETRVYMAVMCAPASGYRFALLYLRQTFDVFIDSQVKFFEHMGGCFEEGVYDNMRHVVSKFIGKNEKELNKGLLDFAAYYGFKVNVTNCYAGNEKGSVENAVKVIRNAAFATKFEFDSLSCAQKHLDQALIKLNANKDIESERAHLSVKPPAFEAANVRINAHVDKYSCISSGSCLYSVPDSLVGKTVCVKEYPNEVICVVGGVVVARHARSLVPGSMVLDINHYLSTFIRKPGALRNSTALAANAELKALFDQEYADNPKEFIRIMVGCKDKDFEQTLACLRHHELPVQQPSSSTDPIAAQALLQIQRAATMRAQVA